MWNIVNVNIAVSAAKRKQLRIVLIKPSKYDDEGYVIRHFRGVLPSNTLACLSGLTRDLAKRGLLGKDVELKVEIFDDTVERIPVKKLSDPTGFPDRRTVVALAGVQSINSPVRPILRASFGAGGLQVLIGGFHVSGMLALFPVITPEIQDLIDIGVSVVKRGGGGDVGSILRDAWGNGLKPIYDFLGCRPDLTRQPIPIIERKYLRRFITSNFGTIDCSRGCPFNCSFCTIINVQGRKMRVRSPELLIQTLRENYRTHQINFYFFTDDNFARNSCWREIFSMLVKLREDEHIPIQFMIQVDTQSYKIPEFISLAARAGCTQVFIGMESINPKNLKAAGKTQNNVQDYKDLIAAWHNAKIATHVAYIFGFPFDTPESIQEDVRRLQEELGVEQASFFMLTPVPGSRDHVRMVEAGEPMDPDLNNYDSFHETIRHPNFAPGELSESYRNAWNDFYSFNYMRDVLAQANAENYWNIFCNFIWYRNSALIEKGHPMIHGFFRLKDRKDRRPGFLWIPRISIFRRCRGCAEPDPELGIAGVGNGGTLASDTEAQRGGDSIVAEMKRVRQEANRSLRSAELQLAHVRARIRFRLGVPSRLALAFRSLNFRMARGSRTPVPTWNYSGNGPARPKMLLLRPDKVILNLLKDIQLFVLFVRDLARI